MAILFPQHCHLEVKMLTQLGKNAVKQLVVRQ